MMLVPAWLLTFHVVLPLLIGIGLVRGVLRRIGRSDVRGDSIDDLQQQIARVGAMVAQKNVLMDRDVDAIRGALERLAEQDEMLGAALDELALADKNRRSRQSDLLGIAASEFDDVNQKLKDLSETFRLLAEDTFDPELDGDRDDVDVDLVDDLDLDDLVDLIDNDDDEDF